MTHTLSEAARLTGINRDTLHTWAQRGKIKVRRTGEATSVTLVELSDIWEFIKNRYRPGRMLQKAGIGFAAPSWAGQQKDNAACRYRGYYSTSHGVMEAIVVDGETGSVCWSLELYQRSTKDDALDVACIKAAELEAQDATQ